MEYQKAQGEQRPPVPREPATDTVLEQAELLAGKWAA